MKRFRHYKGYWGGGWKYFYFWYGKGGFLIGCNVYVFANGKFMKVAKPNL